MQKDEPLTLPTRSIPVDSVVHLQLDVVYFQHRIVLVAYEIYAPTPPADCR